VPPQPGRGGGRMRRCRSRTVRQERASLRAATQQSCACKGQPCVALRACPAWRFVAKLRSNPDEIQEPDGAKERSGFHGFDRKQAPPPTPPSTPPPPTRNAAIEAGFGNAGARATSEPRHQPTRFAPRAKNLKDSYGIAQDS